MSHIWPSHVTHVNESCHTCEWVTSHMWMRVVPSRISNLERKRGQYQDYGFVRAKRQRNVASKRRYLRNVWKEPCTGCRFVTFVTFLRFFDIVGFAEKLKTIPTVWQKPRKVTKCHTFSNLWYKATFTFYVWIRLGTTLSHVTHVNESCHTCESVNQSCHTCKSVMSQMWMSHVTHVNESCHTCEWVMSHIW